MAPKRDTSNEAIYNRLDSLRLEVKQDIQTAVQTVAMSQGRLEKKFDDLEAGRLTRAEGHINDLRLELQSLTKDTTNAEKTLSGKLLALGLIGTIILTALINAVMGWVFRRIK